MPVSELSRNFYEKFGDDLTDELVNCLNTIESSYRLELGDLFDAHFGRFEAKLEQRLAGVEARFEQRLADVQAQTALRFAAVDLKIEQLRVELHREIGSAIRWHFAVWVPVALAVIGLYFKP